MTIIDAPYPPDHWVTQVRALPPHERDYADWFMAAMITFRWQRLGKAVNMQEAFERYRGKPW